MAYAILVLVIYSPVVFLPAFLFSLGYLPFSRNKAREILVASISAICLLAWAAGFADEYLVPTWRRWTGQECQILVDEKTPQTRIQIRFHVNNAPQCPKILKLGPDASADRATNSPFGPEVCDQMGVRILSNQGRKLSVRSAMNTPTSDGGRLWTYHIEY